MSYTSDELLAEELRLEEETHYAGVHRYENKLSKAIQDSNEINLQANIDMLKLFITPLAEAIKAEINNTRPHRHGIAIKYLRDIDPQVVALITLKHVLNGIHMPRKLLTLSREIGGHVEDEAHFSTIPKDVMLQIYAAVKQQSAYIRKKHAIAGVLKTNGDSWESWDDTVKIHVGIWLLDRVIDSTGIITVELFKHDKCNAHLIKPTQFILNELEKRNSVLKFLFPDYNPMVVPPLDWVAFNKGGYYTPHIPQKNFVKCRWSEAVKELKKPEVVSEMSEVYKGVNTIQQTAWRINPVVLECLKHLVMNKIMVGDLPFQGEIEAPRCPLCGQEVVYPHKCFETDKEAFALWKKKKKLWHYKLCTNASKLELVSRVISVARKFVKYPAVYFPYTCDFRGRIYALTSSLSPQGCDYSKGLLEFAVGKPIKTEEGLKWYKIAGANHWGHKLDKKAFSDRVSWIDANKDWICEIVEDPINNLEWSNADEPFQFLAWALDFAQYCKDPKNYETHAIVAMDGSCNGLQHFSALLRDEVGGRVVNLIPADKPQDIYQVVADKVNVALREILDKGDTESYDYQMALKWLEVGVNRKTTKRTVMVVPYGGTRMACREYVQEYLNDKKEERLQQAITDNMLKDNQISYADIEQQVTESFPFSTAPYSIFNGSVWLAYYVWSAIESTVIGARKAMGAMQKLARVVTKAKKPIKWTTPTGFKVIQIYKDIKSIRIKTKLQDSLIYLRYNSKISNKISSKQQANGVSPNFIHSLDASALIKTVLRCKAKGIDNFALVHDSYGTHADDAPLMAKILREEFVKIYSDNDLIENLFKTNIEAIKDDVSEDDLELLKVPEKGNLNLEDVKNSDYFFA